MRKNLELSAGEDVTDQAPSTFAQEIEQLAPEWTPARLGVVPHRHELQIVETEAHQRVVRSLPRVVSTGLDRESQPPVSLHRVVEVSDRDDGVVEAVDH